MKSPAAIAITGEIRPEDTRSVPFAPPPKVWIDARHLVMTGILAAIAVASVILIGVICGAAVTTIVQAVDGFTIPDPIIIVEPVQKPTFVSRSDVNDSLRRAIVSGRSEEVYHFYDQYTKNREITFALVNTALLSEIPANLLFGLVAWESGFDPEARNDNGGSSDHGLMQLNSLTFSALSVEDLHDPLINIRYGAGYLISRFEELGSWEAAVIAYNGGNAELVRGTTIRHLVNVLAFEREYDRAFVETFGE